MKARQQFANEFPQFARHVAFMSALIIMQRKCWAYYSILLTCQVVWTKSLPTAGTDGVYIYINPDFFLNLPTDGQRAFLLAHEVGHVVLRHPWRSKFYSDRGFHSMRGTETVPFNAKAMNISEDYVINADLIAHGMEPIPDGCYSDRFGRDELCDAVYLTLYDEQDAEEFEPPPPPKDEGEEEDDGEDDGESGEGDEGSEGFEGDESAEDEGDESANTDKSGGNAGDDDGDGDGDDESDPVPSDHGGTDDHFEPQYDGSEEEQASDAAEDQAEVQRNIDQALDALDEARDRGEKHASISDSFGGAGYRHSGDGLAADVDWRGELADVITRVGSEGEQTWGRIQRRKLATIGVVMPCRLGTMDRMAVIMDISSSVNKFARHQYMVELAAMIDLMQPTSGCLILWTNTDVEQADEVFSGAELLDLDIPYGGGTVMSSGVRYMEENGLIADVTMCFTDGDLWDDDDWNGLAAADVVVVLDRHPSSWVADPMRRCGVRHIVATDDKLAA